MPTISMQTSISCSEEQKKALVKQLSAICAKEIGKPEAYVLASIQDGVTMLFGGQPSSAMVEIKSIGGLDPMVNKKLSKEVCDLITGSIGVESNHIYISFTEFIGQNWGWNGTTF